MRLPAAAQRKAEPKPPPHLGRVTIDRFSELTWRPEDNYIQSPGPVRLILRNAITGEETLLEADDVEGSPTGDIVVKGGLRLVGPEGILTGRGLTFRAADRTGQVLNAEARRENLLVRAGKIEMLPNQNLRASQASFTTCTEKRPHYHISARELRVSPEGKVRAKQITFWIGGTRILSLPGFEKSFRRAVENPIPLPSFSKETGIQLRLSNDPISEPATSFDYNILLPLRRTPQGTVSFEHDLGSPAENAAPPRTRVLATLDPLRTSLETNPALLRSVTAPSQTERRTILYALVAANHYVYNRRRTDLRVSRLPEVGVSLLNILNRPPLEEDPRSPRPQAESVFGRGFFRTDNWLLNVEAGLGYFSERPTRAETSRLGARTDATSPLFRFAHPLYVRFGGTGWVNVYGTGRAYSILAPELELNVLLGRSTLLSAAYRYQQEFGKTPFVFDRRDVRKELRLRYGFLGGRWAYDLAVKYDLDRKRAYDTGFSIRRRFDCMEIGFGYQTRAQGFGIILNLLPGAAGTSARE